MANVRVSESPDSSPRDGSTKVPFLDIATGCFQCTKRRIICDNTQPTCVKCQKKGIECSGPGRIRFSTGVAQRGKLKGCVVPVLDASPESAIEAQSQAENAAPLKIRWKNDPPMRARRKTARRLGKASSVNPGSFNGTSDAAALTHEGTLAGRKEGLKGRDATNERLDCPFEGTLVKASAGPLAWIAPLNPQARMLMSHCSPPFHSFGSFPLTINSRGASRTRYGRIGYLKWVS